ncbi:MAG: hypothetical protein ABIS39_01165 [Sphingomicrobium sp.]
MYSFKLVAAATLLLPTVGLAQDNNAELGAKAWLPSNFRFEMRGVAVQDGHTYLNVQSSADIDEDGVSDEGIVRLQCAGSELQAAHYTVKSPRDSASGMASGKRMHKPFTLVTEWGAATPELKAIKPTYDIKQAKGARMTSDGGGWTLLRLANADGLCAAAARAAINNSHSNIKNK